LLWLYLLFFVDNFEEDIKFDLKLLNEFVDGLKSSLDADSVIVDGEYERVMLMRLDSFLNDGKMRIDLS
jgi:hypothetical protein